MQNSGSESAVFNLVEGGFGAVLTFAHNTFSDIYANFQKDASFEYLNMILKAAKLIGIENEPISDVSLGCYRLLKLEVESMSGDLEEIDSALRYLVIYLSLLAEKKVIDFDIEPIEAVIFD